MRKLPIFSVTLLLLYFLTLALPVQAESAQNVTKRRPDRPAQTEIQEIRQENRSKVAENHANRLKRRFEFYYDRLSNIISRFEAHLAILDKEGKGTADTISQLGLAKTKLAAAKTEGAAAIAAFTAIDPAKFSEQKDQLVVARDLANSARELFQQTHRLLQEALMELKTISKPAN